MRLAIFSDVHGDIYALEKLYKLEVNEVDQFICLGDSVGYLPLGYECIDFLKDRSDTIHLLGNHEEMLLKGLASNNCSDMAKLFFEINYKYKEKYDILFLKQLEQKYFFQDVMFTHTIEGRYIYENSIISEIEKDVFIGHSHRQFLIKSLNNKKIINCGSLGQNRNSLSLCEYCVFDTDENKIFFKNFIRKYSYIEQQLRFFEFPQECYGFYEKYLL